MMPGESDSLHLPLRAILLVPKYYNCVARARARAYYFPSPSLSCVHEVMIYSGAQALGVTVSTTTQPLSHFTASDFAPTAFFLILDLLLHTFAHFSLWPRQRA